MRYLLGILVTLGLIILIIVLLVSGRGSKGPAAKVINLPDYVTTNSYAQLLTDGPINADQDHRQVKITVEQNQVTATIYSGYQQTVLQQKTFESNQSAYNAFLHALQHSGFTLRYTGAPSDETGYCPMGDRYVLNMNSDGKDIVRTWTTSCGSNIKGSFAGSIDTIQQLFQAQVPDYDTFTSGVEL